VSEPLGVIIAIGVFAAWLIPVAAAFWKRRPWAGMAGFAAPLFLLGVFIWGLSSCLGGSGDCSTENVVTYWAILLALGMLIWTWAAALLPRHQPTGTTQGQAQTNTGRSPSDRSLSGWGLVVAVMSAAFGAGAAASESIFPGRLNLIAAGWTVACAVGLIVVTARHRTRYPTGPGRWWLAGGWVPAALAVLYVASPGPYFEMAMSRIGRSSLLLAAALAAACIGLLIDFRSITRKTRPQTRSLPAR
jgi:hypothetical protein